MTGQSTKKTNWEITVKVTASISAVALCAATTALADCDTVTFSDVGWTDITATTAATTLVLEGLGYETDVKVLSVPVTNTSLANGDIDVFLGNWMPTMEGDIACMKRPSLLLLRWHVCP